MKQLFISFLFVLSTLQIFAQKSEKDILEDRAQHAVELADTAYGLMNQDEIDHFGGLNYFDFDEAYQINAMFTKDKGKVFKMQTSTERLPKYRRYGYADFTINGKACRLEVYQSMASRRDKTYKNYLFIPFRDGTSRHETYGGGRFMDVLIPEGETVLLDFNTVYNPYCAYSYRYSCPIPPEANTLEIKIKAGEKTPFEHK